MRNNLYHTWDSALVKIDYGLMEEIIERIHPSQESCFFLFSLLTGKCTYFCPSIIHILGFDHRKYLNKGYSFFKSIVHPQDFYYFMDEILTLVETSENLHKKLFYGDHPGLTVRIRNREGSWTATRIYLVYIRDTGFYHTKMIQGFIEPVYDSHYEVLTTAFTITNREKEVFRYLSDGQSAKMIADRLCISEATVITHRKNLIQKLHVKNSAELIKKGFEYNLLSQTSFSNSGSAHIVPLGEGLR